MTTIDFEVFLSVYRHKNISKAAEALHITQATLSIRLKALEEELGCTLLIRGKGKRSLSLTAQGQAFYQLALQHNNLMDKIKNIDKSVGREMLQLSTITSVGDYLLPPVLTCFFEKYPQVRLNIQVMEAAAACLSILHGTTDMSLSTAKMETEQIVATPLLQESFVIICSVDSTLPPIVTLEDLPRWEEIYIQWSAEYAFWHQTAFNDEIPCQIQLDLIGQIGMFVSQPGRWAIVPKSVADCLCTSFKLRQCVPNFRIPYRRLYILRHRDNASTVGIDYFMDALREVLQQTYGENFLL